MRYICAILWCLFFSLSSPTSFAAEKIDPYSGFLLLSEIDLSVSAGAVNLAIKREFVPGTKLPGPLGAKWRLNWEGQLIKSESAVMVLWATKLITFENTKKKSEMAGPLGERLILEKSGGAQFHQPDGQQARFDAQGRMVETKDANNNVTALIYDEKGYLSKIAGPAQVALTLTTDTEGRITRIRASNGDRVEYEYEGADLVSVSINGVPRTRYSYNGQGDLTGIEDPLSGVARLNYNDRHQVTSRKWADGSQEYYDYQNNGLTTRHTDAVGHVTTWVRTPDGRRIEMSDPLGNLTVIEYNRHGLPDTVTGPTGSRSRYRYDDLGRMIEISGCCGSTRFAYIGSSSRYKTIHENDGRKYDFEYDDHGNLLTVKRNGAVITTLTYFPNGLLKSSVSEGSPKVTYTYLSNGQVSTVTDAEGNKTTYHYDRRGNRIREIDARGETTVWTYDGQNRIVGKKDAAGVETGYAYDDVGRLIEIVAPGNRKIRYRYDLLGRVSEVTDPAGRTTRYRYDAANRVIAETDANRHTYRYQYDALGNLTEIINPLGGKTIRRFDTIGLLIEETTPAGKKWRYTYSDTGQLLEANDSQGYFIKHSYDRRGRRIASVDVTGGKTQYSYDDRDRVIELIHPDGHTESYTYDMNDRIVRAGDNRGKDIQYVHNLLGRVIREQWAGGFKIKYRYDALGRLVGRRDNLAGDTNYIYNLQGLLSQERNAIGAVSHFTYDPAGRLSEMVNPLGHTFSMSYTPNGELAKRTSPAGEETSFQYDRGGHPVKITGPSGGAVSLNYDALGNVTHKTGPLEAHSRFVYDEASRLVSATDPKGQTTTFAYDNAGNLTRKRLSDGTVIQYVYDQVGRLVSADDGKFPVHYAYTRAGLLKEISYPAVKRRLKYAYDDNGRMSQFTDSEGTVFTYTYNIEGLLEKITDDGNRPITFGYDAKGRLTLIQYPNGITAKRQYDELDRPLHITYTDAADRQMAGWSYAYDAADNLIRVTDTEGKIIRYAYDEDGRLVEERRPTGTIRYSYLPGGNRGTLKTGNRIISYRYNKADQLLQAADQEFQYDAAGNLTRKTGPKGTTSYHYDAENRLIAVTRPDSGQVRFGYAPTGERVWRQDSRGTVYFVPDGTHLVAELDQTLKPLATYLHGPGIDNPLMRKANGKASYYHADSLGSIRALSDAGGRPLSIYSTDAFGNPLAQSEDANPFTFTSREYDKALGLYYYRARYYDPKLGRFISKDPLDPALRGANLLNPYVYVRNAPTRFADPLGLLEIPYSEIRRLAAKLRDIDPSEVQMPGRLSPSQQLPRLVRGDPRLADYAQPGVKHYKRIYFPTDRSGGDPLVADMVKKPSPPRPPVGNRNLTNRGGDISPSQEIRRVDYVWGKGNLTGRHRGPSTQMVSSGGRQSPSTRVPTGTQPPPGTPGTVSAPVGPTPPSQSAPVVVQNQPGPAWNPKYVGPRGHNRLPDTRNWEKIPKNPNNATPTSLTDQIGAPVIHFLVTWEQLLKCRENKVDRQKCLASIIKANVAWAAVRKMALASGSTKAVIAFQVLGRGICYLKLVHDTASLLYNMSSWLAAEFERWDAEERHQRTSQINLEARLDEDLQAIRKLIVDSLEKYTLERDRNCKAIKGMAEQAKESAKAAEEAKAVLPALDGTYDAWLADVEKCDPATRKQTRLKEIFDQNRYALDDLREHLQKAADIATNCRSRQDPDKIREEIKAAEKIGVEIVKNKDEARELAGQLNEILEALRRAKAMYRDALSTREKIVRLAGDMPKEKALSEKISGVDSQTHALVEEGNRLKKKVDLLRKGYPDELKPEVATRFEKLKWLIYEYQSRGACNTLELRHQFNEDAGKVVEIRLAMENKLKPFIDRHQEIEDCPTEAPNKILKQIIDTKVESESLLEKAKDLEVIAEECERAIDKRDATVTLRRLRPLVDNFADIKITGILGERTCDAPKALQLKAGQQSKLFLEYTVHAPPGSLMSIRLEPRIVGWVHSSDFKAHPLKLPPVVSQVQLGEREKQRTLYATLPLQIPYPSFSEGEKKSDTSPHEFYLDVFANNKKLYTMAINNAFDVRGPGTDFNGTGDLDVCVMKQDEKDAYPGNVRITVAGPRSITKTFSGSTFRLKLDEKSGFGKIPLGSYTVRADVLDDQDHYKGPRSGTTKVTLFRWNPKDRHVKPSFGATVVLGRGHKKPSFVSASDPKPKPKPTGPREWYIHVKVIDNKKIGIKGARVSTAWGSMAAKNQGQGKYLIGPIKNIENLSERTVDIIADISFQSPLSSPLMNQQIRSVELKDKAHVYVTIQFDITTVPSFVGGSGGGKSSSGGSGTGRAVTPPKTGGVSGAPGQSSGSPQGQGGGGGGGGYRTTQSPGHGSEGEIGSPRDRIFCIKSICTMCEDHLFGEFYGSDCNNCIKENMPRIQKCIEGYKKY